LAGSWGMSEWIAERCSPSIVRIRQSSSVTESVRRFELWRRRDLKRAGHQGFEGAQLCRPRSTRVARPRL
jgi:hypothetical protein